MGLGHYIKSLQILRKVNSRRSSRISHTTPKFQCNREEAILSTNALVTENQILWFTVTELVVSV